MEHNGQMETHNVIMYCAVLRSNGCSMIAEVARRSIVGVRE